MVELLFLFASSIFNYYFKTMIARMNNRNQYGMKKQSLPLDDDRQAFTAVQLERYLKRKRTRRFNSQVERDVILDIISEHWKDMSVAPELSQMDTEGKIRAFYHITVVFPYFVAEEESVITVDFRKKGRINGHESCFCGSGLPMRQCCGAISSVEDFLSDSK